MIAISALSCGLARAETPLAPTPTPPSLAPLEAAGQAGYTTNGLVYVIGPPACRTTCEEALSQLSAVGAEAVGEVIRREGHGDLLTKYSGVQLKEAVSKVPGLMDKVNATASTDALRQQADAVGACFAQLPFCGYLDRSAADRLAGMMISGTTTPGRFSVSVEKTDYGSATDPAPGWKVTVQDSQSKK